MYFCLNNTAVFHVVMYILFAYVIRYIDTYHDLSFFIAMCAVERIALLCFHVVMYIAQYDHVLEPESS